MSEAGHESVVAYYAALDNGGETPVGSAADTWYDGDTRMKTTAEMHDVEARLERGEIDQEEATTLLDLLAAQQG